MRRVGEPSDYPQLVVDTLDRPVRHPGVEVGKDPDRVLANRAPPSLGLGSEHRMRGDHLAGMRHLQTSVHPAHFPRRLLDHGDDAIA